MADLVAIAYPDRVIQSSLSREAEANLEAALSGSTA
jgi:uncharacterized membrane protein